MRVVFFGTPAFAVPSLRALAREGAQLVAVVTRPDRPRGRSRSTLVPPPVKEAALELGLPVLQPERPRGDIVLTQLRRLAPELGVVVAYGHLIPPDLLALPRLGMVNVHASLLPRHRGAAPVAHAILQGDRRTGVTIMQMDEGLDTGPILHQLETAVGPDETAGELAERLAELGAQALVETLVLLQRGEVKPVPQDGRGATLAPKLTREEARIPWAEPPDAVARRIRAFDPAPGAWTTAAGTEAKLYRPRPLPEAAGGEPGTVLRTDPALVVAAGGGAVEILEAQPAGRRRMPSADWCRGSGPRPGDRFT